jgi:hypothetical protein
MLHLRDFLCHGTKESLCAAQSKWVLRTEGGGKRSRDGSNAGGAMADAAQLWPITSAFVATATLRARQKTREKIWHLSKQGKSS